MKNKKILYFIQLPPPIHGAAKTNELVYKSKIINNGLNKRLIRVNYSSNLASINKFNLSKFFIYFKLYFRFLFELILQRPDLIYYTIPPTGVGFYKDLPFVFTLKLFRVKPLYHLHGIGIYEQTKSSRFKTLIHRWVYSNAIVVHLSKNLIAKEIKTLALKKSNLFIVNNGIEIYNVSTEPEEKNEFIDILFLSNITISKGILMALEIIQEVLKQYSKIRLNIIGDFRDDLTKNKVIKIIKENNLQEKVVFFGSKYNNEKCKLISQMDFLLYPSYNDAYPLVLLECMQYGLPIVASDQGAIPEIVTEDIGFVFKTGDTEEAVEYCKNMIKKILLGNNILKKKCKDIFIDRYTSEIFEKNMRDVIIYSLSEKKLD